MQSEEVGLFCWVMHAQFLPMLKKLMSSTLIISKDHWSSPNVSGDKPPPMRGFTLSKIAEEKIVLHGGKTAQGVSSELRVATVVGDSVVSACVLQC